MALQTPTSAQNAQQHLPPLMTALTVTSTASMEGMLLGHLVPALALPATLVSVVQTALPVLQAIVDHLLMFALLILV